MLVPEVIALKAGEPPDPRQSAPEESLAVKSPVPESNHERQLPAEGFAGAAIRAASWYPAPRPLF